MPTILIDQLDGSVLAHDCGDGDTLRGAWLHAGGSRAPACHRASCGRCRFLLVEGEIATTSRLPRTDAAPAWRLGCRSYPLGDCRVRFEAPAPGA